MAKTTKLGNRLFISRRFDRVDPRYGEAVRSTCLSNGFVEMYPEKFSLAEQITIISNAKVIAGFEGSGLHNSIFGASGVQIIEFGSTRFSKSANYNQTICADISRTNLRFVPYRPWESLSQIESAILDLGT
jgi:capsular polysaccharide biosynthesis protein